MILKEVKKEISAKGFCETRNLIIEDTEEIVENLHFEFLQHFTRHPRGLSPKMRISANPIHPTPSMVIGSIK